jgi:hypothetical protein
VTVTALPIVVVMKVVTASPDREQTLAIVPLYVEYNVSSYSE